MEKQGNGKKEENSAYKPCESCGIVWNSEAILSSKAIPRYRSQAITSYQANCAGCVNFNEEPMSVRIAEEPVENAEVNEDESWQYEEIILKRDTSGWGWGFMISGGIDDPHIGVGNAICIWKIISGGAASKNGRLNVNDCIVSVNGVSLVDATEKTAVKAFRNAGNTAKLNIKRKRLAAGPIAADVDLVDVVSALDVPIAQAVDIGLDLAGASDNQNIPGDNGTASHMSENLSTYDRLCLKRLDELKDECERRELILLISAMFGWWKYDKKAEKLKVIEQLTQKLADAEAELKALNKLLKEKQRLVIELSTVADNSELSMKVVEEKSDSSENPTED